MINTDAPLPEDLFAALPGEDAVLGHDVAVNCDRWQDVLSTRGLPPMQGALAGPGVTKSVEELEGVERILEGLQGELGQQLAELLTADEIASLAARCARLRSAGPFPAPSGDMPAVPWPLF